MDQSDFRNMLATPRAGGSGAIRSFGAVQPKRTAAGETKEVFKKPEFKPRDKTGKNKFGKKKEGEEEGSESNGSEYRDRAAERRLGVDSDFSAAERLLEDFKARGEGSDDREAIEEQMKYLGGDSEHTILVSGLDHALLNRRKFELSKANEQSVEDVEATLDEIFEQSASTNSKVNEPKKRSRDEMMNALKAARGGGNSNGTTTSSSNNIVSDEGLGEAKAAGRFVSIGKPSKKKVEGVEGGELKKRKKKKVKTEVDSSNTLVSIPTASSTLSTPSTESKPSLVLPPPEEDFDDDIFGGVADYKGLGSDSDSEDDTVKKESIPKPVTSTTNSTLPTASYFDEDDSEETFKLSLSTAPSSVTNLTKSSSASNGNNNELEEGEENEVGEGSNMRLQPLAGAGPSIRDLLAIDESAEREEKRKAKKLKFSKGSEKVWTEEEKSNRDHQKMMNHLDKEKNKKGKD